MSLNDAAHRVVLDSALLAAREAEVAGSIAIHHEGMRDLAFAEAGAHAERRDALVLTLGVDHLCARCVDENSGTGHEFDGGCVYVAAPAPGGAA